ncbi:MAG: sigma 54-interacting transcriptional regulator [bacterium]
MIQKSLIRDLMTRAFETITPDDDLQTVARIMRSTGIDDLPVTDDNDRLLGILTKSSFLDAMAAGKSLRTPVQSLYKKGVITLFENQTYEESAEEIRTARFVGSAIVLNDSQEIVGVLSQTAWISAMLKKEAFLSTQLNAILDAMHNGLITIDADARMTSMNQAAEKILKTSAAESQGRKLAELFPGLRLEQVLILGRPAIGIRYWQTELRLLCNISPIESENTITGAVVVFQDLTDLIRTVSELESLTVLYGTLQSVMDIAYDGLIVTDENSCISMVNNSAATFFRKKEKEMLGRPVEELIENSRVRAVVQTGIPEINQLQFIKGTPYVVSILPILQKEMVIGAVCKILFRHLEEVRGLADSLSNIDQQLAFYKEQSRERPAGGSGFDQIVTADPVFKKIKEEGEIVARGASNILITGESGTGKELVAQAIHAGSHYAKGPLVKINCAAIPENLLESEFFGYAPGAFSGAHKEGKSGKLVSAQGGTLFLDEIGDMSLSLQSKLLRVLQDKQFEPVGSTQTVEVNIRIISATNQNLEQLIEEGRFRADLYYRLNVVNFHIPPLRDRVHDISLLVHTFLEKYNRIFGTRIQTLSADARQLLLNHNWPGNVRELENVIERAINFAIGDCIEKRDLPPYLTEKQSPAHTPSDSRNVAPQQLRESRVRLDRDEILNALAQTGGNRLKAARLLGISRSWLYEKMKSTGLV